MTRRTVSALVVAAALSLSACGSAAQQPCMLLENGTELCGSKAVAWCQMTFDERWGSVDAMTRAGINADDPTWRGLMATGAACSDIRNAQRVDSRP